MIDWIVSTAQTLGDRALIALSIGWNWISEEWIVGVLIVALIFGVRIALKDRV